MAPGNEYRPLRAQFLTFLKCCSGLLLSDTLQGCVGGGRYKLEGIFRKFRMMLISSMNVRDGRK